MQSDCARLAAGDVEDIKDSEAIDDKDGVSILC